MGDGDRTKDLPCQIGAIRPAGSRTGIVLRRCFPGGHRAGDLLCSSHYDLDVVAEEFNRLSRAFSSSAAPQRARSKGLPNHSLVGASFNRAAATAISCRMEPLQNFDMSGSRRGGSTLGRLRNEAASASSRNTFALLLIDGPSVREEQVVRAVQSGLGGMSLIGGRRGRSQIRTDLFTTKLRSIRTRRSTSGSYAAALPGVQDPALRQRGRPAGGHGSRCHPPCGQGNQRASRRRGVCPSGGVGQWRCSIPTISRPPGGRRHGWNRLCPLDPAGQSRRDAHVLLRNR